MHKKLLASAALVGLLAGGAWAQTPPAASTVSGTIPATTAAAPAPRLATPPAARHAAAAEPFSVSASNIVPGDTRSLIAPRLPTPSVGDNASPEQLLTIASTALQKNDTGLAQEALERAETRLLDRAVTPTAANQPSTDPRIKDIVAARQNLGYGRLQQARQSLAQALAMTGTGTKGA
jgi:hypothetical protein